MIHVFPASYEGHSQPARTQTQRLTFEVDDANSELIKDFAVFPRGKPVMIVVYEMVEGVDPLRNMEENAKDMKKNMLSRIHATIKTYEKETGIDAVTIKKVLKARLKARYPDLDKDSLGDLEEIELANALDILQTELSPSHYNYSQHKTYVKSE